MLHSLSHLPYTPLLVILLLGACTLENRLPASNKQSSTASSVASVPNKATLEPADIVVATSSSTARLSLEQELLSGGMLSVGNPNADTVLTVITNHACVYCQEFHGTLMPMILEHYVRTGKVRLEILPLQLTAHPSSSTDARMLYCAAEQERGMVAHDLLMITDRTPATIRQRLEETGINLTVFDACVNREDSAVLYEAAQQTAQSLGVTRTPSYILNGTVYIGVPQEADLRGQINTAVR